MGERKRPAVYSIAAHRAFSDALVAGLAAQHGEEPMSLARGIILVPNNRAQRSITDAFIRRMGRGGLLPRIIPIGDPDLGERLGTALDAIGAGLDLPPAIGVMERQMILARMVQNVRADMHEPIDAAEAMRLGKALGSVLDQLLVEQVDTHRLYNLEMSSELSFHWQKSLAMFRVLLEQWPSEIARRGKIDMADRRNRLLEHVARRWAEAPPASFVVAVAGVSTTAPAVAQLLRTIARLPQGQVVLAELDQNMTDEEWDAIGPFPPDPITGRSRPPHETHPQFALKQLLDRMGIAREEVAQWRWGSSHDARAIRSRNISNAMLVPRLTTKWHGLASAERSLSGVKAIEAATPAEEAQAIAIALREVLETPGRTAALVTPDRKLAMRVSAHLRRWGIEADDSAGQPLAETPPGTLLLGLSEAIADHFAPISLLALLKHPLVMKGERRLKWLEEVRRLDLLLRGPRPPAGLAGIDALLNSAQDGNDRRSELRATVKQWWRDACRPLLEPLERLAVGVTDLPASLRIVREVGSMLTADQLWAGHQGHAAAALFDELENAAPEGPTRFDIRSLPAFLAQAMEGVAVRPPQGGHPRIAIYGLLEARLQQADLMILAGLNEGTWPQLPAPDPWLAPRIRQELGLPALERRIGLAAHDLASGLGAPQVLITRSRRDGSAPAIASRFWLRLKAMAGPQWKLADRYLACAEAIDDPGALHPARQPAPDPPVATRPRTIAVTDVDRLKADPFAFYARKMLNLSLLDPVDADPSAAWRGTAVHRILQDWAVRDGCDPERLEERAHAMLASADSHPLMRTLWQPRLVQAVRWIGEQVRRDFAEGRRIGLVETEGRIAIAGVTLKGTADRIDMLADGTIAIVDYKTGKPPSARMVAAGFSMQLGLLGLIAEEGGFSELDAGRRAAAFEYWSLGKSRKSESGFGYRESPVDPEGKRGKVVTGQFTALSRAHFVDAVQTWLTGPAPFTAKLRPDIPTFGDYDHLMRLEEWYGRGSAGG